MSKTIDQLPPANPLTGTETLPLNQAGVTRFSTINAIIAFMGVTYDAIGTAAAAITAHLGAFAHGDIAHANRAVLDLVSGTNTGDQDIAAWLAANKPGLNGLESAVALQTWTPSDISGAGMTLTPVNCKYLAIGKMIHLTGQITFPTTADTNPAKIGGLPFDPLALQSTVSFNTVGTTLFGTCVVIPGSAMQFYNNLGAAAPRLNSALSGATVYVNISYLSA